jgi:hypothetical protein
MKAYRILPRSGYREHPRALALGFAHARCALKVAPDDGCCSRDVFDWQSRTFRALSGDLLTQG